ncbi:MAG: S8 family peptidase [Gammaproteobacteria bacterium]|nr:S8 family peptidase [Gammaproteobacteria bacterium]MCY4278996.1 S8 family peptidase [Gammaproteobacteria bacterium]
MCQCRGRCEDRPYSLKTLATLATLTLIGCSGGGGGSNEQTAPPPPPPPTEVSLTLATEGTESEITEIDEWDERASVELTVALAETRDTGVLVNLNSTGSATLGGDFELSERQVRIPGGSRTASLHISPIRDFEAEGDETIHIALGTIEGNAEAGDSASVSLALTDQGALFENTKDNIYGKLYVSFHGPAIERDAVTFSASVHNIGSAETSSTKLGFWASTRNDFRGRRLFYEVIDLPPIMPGGNFLSNFRVALDAFPGAGTYYAIILTDSPAEEAPGVRRAERRGGLVIQGDGSVRVRCPDLERNQSPGIEDPLRPAQWNLANTGQDAYARTGGIEGADLRMTETLDNGPTGKGIRVAVVDTGMEICHPDLAANVEAGTSFNFNQGSWRGSLETDPFFLATFGDHGTSVAGIIGAVANNGIGLRGVAPDVRLRAYNFLSTRRADSASDSLGGSSNRPNSSDVDIFNMSFGLFGGEYLTLPEDRKLFQHGVRNLRSGKGALYIQAGGNGFNRCNSMLRRDEVRVGETEGSDGVTVTPVFEDYDINAEIGCVSANTDPWRNLPYIIQVGAFRADDTKSSYSSAGSALWVSAPAGQWGIAHPGQITTDQMGRNQGYDANSIIPANENPHGDYINSFTGTSAAAPSASGAVALLLEANPDFTWRDVKYILARSARILDADIDEVKIGFGGEAAVLRHRWITNAAGYHFHNWYGFGAIDVDAALALAATHAPDSLGTFRDGMDVFAVREAVNIPDHQGGGVRQRVNVNGLDDALKVESVVVQFSITHPFTNDLGIYLVSPSGTTSLVNPPFNDVLADNEDLDWELLSNAFYGESPLGDWTLRVIDAAAGDVGTLESWSLTFYLGEIPAKS